MKRCLSLIASLFVVAIMQAQVEDGFEKSKEESKKMFEQFKQNAKKEFDDFRRQANEEYARFMEQAWTSYNVMDAEEPPMSPKPVMGLEDPAPVTNSQIEYDEVIASPYDRLPQVQLPLGALSNDALELVGQPEPMEPMALDFDINATVMSLSLYGADIPIRVSAETTKPIKLKNISEKSVARMWRKLSCPYYDHIVAECLNQREKKRLCDWGYVKLTEKMAEKYFGQDTNEAVVMQMYILVQSGYQMRIAMADGKLTLLMGSKEKIYQYKYFIMDKIQYYIIDKSMKNKSMLVFDRAFPNEKSLSLALVQPKLGVERTGKRVLKAKDYPEVEVSIETNKNLLDFYNDYPVCGQWNYYTYASLSEVVKKSLYPALQHAISGKSEVEAANILLNFVQTGFEYQTDDIQFGYERPLYPDETLFYPYCDCEDRSILFACLVRELLGLDVVLLNYPNHVTTAVHFSEPVKGDYLTIDDEVYTICEPTFISGAPVGCSGAKFKGMKPDVMRL